MQLSALIHCFVRSIFLYISFFFQSKPAASWFNLNLGFTGLCGGQALCENDISFSLNHSFKIWAWWILASLSWNMSVSSRKKNPLMEKPGHSYSGSQLTSYFGPIMFLNLDLKTCSNPRSQHRAHRLVQLWAHHFICLSSYPDHSGTG